MKKRWINSGYRSLDGYSSGVDLVNITLMTECASFGRSDQLWPLGLRPQFPSCRGGCSSIDPICFGRVGVTQFMVIVKIMEDAFRTSPFGPTRFKF
ncbi:hypothetical protein AVEN_34767-1 [Araneus ventricosus]|uniref:Uncharacterized protein n=1 Tax=Araneus ventricosus TaxID=182803 RepID=A0A4Y2C5P0_ARAVE|nr:hypothetical protein AVEN_235775-1 [Araneus ventricosus]GBM00584.1 hypothetical protein AVEN_34767-1 [Araneus ventricosus]